MKKLLFSLAFGALLMLSSNVSASAANNEDSKYPSNSDIDSLNNELQNLVEEANKKLAVGEKDIEVSSGDLKLIFKDEDVNNGLQPFASRAISTKRYQAYIVNTTGLDFTHSVSGNFSVDGKKFTAITHDTDLSGPMYSKTVTESRVEGQDANIIKDASVAKVISKGTFKALAVGWLTYYTTIVVRIMAPDQSYVIEKATISQ